MGKNTLVMTALVGVVALFYGARVIADHHEKEAVKIPIQHYFDGQATGSADSIRKAFHTEGRVNFVREGKLTVLTAEEFAGRFNGKAAPDEAQRKRAIESIDIAGNAAVVKVKLDYPAVTLTDYMSLLKVGDEWKIINKTFYGDPKPQPKPAEAKPKAE